MFIITYIGLACQEEILISFEFLLIDNSISNFINISRCQSDVNNCFQFFVKPSQQHLTALTTITTIHVSSSLVNTFLIFYSFFICFTIIMYYE